MRKCRAADWTAEPQGFLTNLQSAGGSDNANSTVGAVSGSNGSNGSSGSNGSNATELRQFGLALHQLWGLLCKEVRTGLLLA
jgi:hypothetical protein